jgi:phenylalanyl-tRNA synthetase beta chain
VTNPIASDQSLLRNSLLPGILRNIRDNSRHLDLFRFFEIGFEIHKRPAPDLPHEIPCLGACVYSRSRDGAAGLRELKRLAECILPDLTVHTVSPLPFEHPVRAWKVVAGDTEVGRICELHPNLAPGRAAVLLLNLEATQSLPALVVKHAPLRRFPSSAFDLSVLAPLRLPVGDLDQLLARSKAPHLLGVEFVREYTGPPLPEDRKSVSFRVTVGADDRTLSNDEINQVRAALIDQLQAAGYQLRI